MDGQTLSEKIAEALVVAKEAKAVYEEELLNVEILEEQRLKLANELSICAINKSHANQNMLNAKQVYEGASERYQALLFEEAKERFAVTLDKLSD